MNISQYDAMEDHSYIKPFDKNFGAPAPNTFEGLTQDLHQRNKPHSKKDAFDGDSDTVSPYDGMELHEHLGRYDTEGFREMAFAQQPRRQHMY